MEGLEGAQRRTTHPERRREVKLSRLVANLAADLAQYGDMELQLPKGQRIADVRISKYHDEKYPGNIYIYAYFEPKSYELVERPDR